MKREREAAGDASKRGWGGRFSFSLPASLSPFSPYLLGAVIVLGVIAVCVSVCEVGEEVRGARRAKEKKSGGGF